MRVRKGAARHRKHKRILKAAKGYRGGRGKERVIAKQQLLKSMYYSYRDRKARKREFRALWIVRINAACRERGLTYGALMAGLRKKGIAINRKMLAELAVRDPKGFNAVVKTAQEAASA